MDPTASRHRLQRGLPGYLILLLPTLSHLSVSLDPGGRLATDVPPDIYAFHRYTWNSTPLYQTRAAQYQMQFPG